MFIVPLTEFLRICVTHNDSNLHLHPSNSQFLLFYDVSKTQVLADKSSAQYFRALEIQVVVVFFFESRPLILNQGRHLVVEADSDVSI